MQIPTDPLDAAALATAVTDPEQWPTWRLLVDWDRDDTFDHDYSDLTGFADTITVSRDSVGALPEEATIVEGFSAASLKVRVSGRRTGDDLDLAQVLAPYRTDSPLYALPTIGARCTLELGLVTDRGPVLLPAFAGVLRSIAPDSRNRTTNLEFLDDVDLLRAPVTLPHHGLHVEGFYRGLTISVNTQWVVDFVLRSNGIYLTPPPKGDALISVTGNNGMPAEIGHSDGPVISAVTTATAAMNTFVESNWPPAMATPGVWASGSPNVSYGGIGPAPFQHGDGIGCSFWLKVGNDMPDTGADPNVSATLFHVSPWLLTYDYLRIRVYADGRIGADVVGALTGGTIYASAVPGATAWRYAGVHWRYNADETATVTIRFGGVTATGSVTCPTRSAGVQDSTLTVDRLVLAAGFLTRPWSHFQVWSSATAPATWPGETFTPTHPGGSIKPGRNAVYYLPDEVQVGSAKLLKEVVAAELGSFRFDEAGIPRFAPNGAIDTSTVEKTVDAGRELIDLGMTTRSDSVRNVITWQHRPAFAFGAAVTGFSAKDVRQFESPPGLTTHEITLPGLTTFLAEATVPFTTTANWNESVLHGFCVVQSPSPAVEAPNVIVLFRRTGVRSAHLIVSNGNAYSVRLATTSGSPALRIYGWPVDTDMFAPTVRELRDAASVGTYGPRSYATPSSEWHQRGDSLDTIGATLLADLKRPVTVIDGIEITGDPRLQLDDTVMITDRAGLSPGVRATITGLTQQVTRGKTTTSLSVRPAAAAGVGILDDAVYGVLDQTMILA